MSEPETERSARRQPELSDTEFHPAGDPAALFDALASSRRLALLWTLSEADGPIPLSRAARRIPERERELDTDDEPGPVAKEVRTTLRHVHVPKLRAAGLVAVDESAGTLRLSIDDGRFLDLLDGAAGIETDV